jgi:hypothetical protein
LVKKYRPQAIRHYLEGSHRKARRLAEIVFETKRRKKHQPGASVRKKRHHGILMSLCGV